MSEQTRLGNGSQPNVDYDSDFFGAYVSAYSRRGLTQVLLRIVDSWLSPILDSQSLPFMLVCLSFLRPVYSSITHLVSRQLHPPSQDRNFFFNA